MSLQLLAADEEVTVLMMHLLSAAHWGGKGVLSHVQAVRTVDRILNLP